MVDSNRLGDALKDLGANEIDGPTSDRVYALTNRRLPWPATLVGAGPFSKFDRNGVDLEAAAPPRFSDESSATLLKRLRSAERLYTIIGWGVTIVGGLAFLYLPSATFGSWADYAKTLLWGTAVGAGATLAQRYLTVAS